jgi:hypothetical protein
LSSRDLETARQLALIELAALVCWKAPHLLADSLMEPELRREALLKASDASSIEKKVNLEQALQERQRPEYNRLISQGRNLGKLFFLDRTASYDWLSAMKNADGAECAIIPSLSAEDHAAIVGLLKHRESFKPWPHKLVLKQASWESSWAAWTLPLEFRPEISAPASRMASMTCLWAAAPCWHVAEWFLNPFLARASDTASAHCARPKPHGHYPLALTGAICRIRSHVAKKSFNQLLYPRIR